MDRSSSFFANLVVGMKKPQSLMPSQRARSRSRSRSPARRGRYDDSRSRSPDRDRYRRRERSPANGNYESGRYGDRSRPTPPQRSNEERSQDKAAMMSNVRDNSQQDRRVYVGNLPYDVKWHALKDFMKEGKSHETCSPLLHVALTTSQLAMSSSQTSSYFRTE